MQRTPGSSLPLTPEPMILGIDMDVSRQTGIENPGEHALLDLLEILVRGDDGRQLLVIPVIEDLVELFPGPGSRILRAEVIEDE